MMSDDLLEDMCRAFADAPGRKADASLTGEDVREVAYDDLPEGSKDWYRTRMRAALELLPVG